MRTAVVDPLGDECDVGVRDRAASPRQARKAGSVERRVAAQTLDETGAIGAAAARRAPAVRAARRLAFVLRRNQSHAVQADLEQPIERQFPEGTQPAVVGGAVARRLAQRISEMLIAALSGDLGCR